MTILGGLGGKGRGSGTGGGGDAPARGGSAIPFVTERDFEREVLRSELPVLLQFTADWCQPCKAIAPDVEAFARETAGKAKVVKVDVDKAPVIAQQLRVQSVPTFMVVAEGRIQDAVVGAIRKNKMREVAIDTRDAAAFKRARLPNAVHMPLEEIESRLAEVHMMPQQPVLYCRSGDKTKDLAGKLADQGVPVAFLEGGLLGWEAESLPIQR
jgi:thioredoxin 1